MKEGRGEKQDPELLEIRYTLNLPCRFSTGPTMGRCLKAMRDEKKLLANRCPKCGRTMLPPRIVCAVCHVEAKEWVELKDTGTLLAFDVVHVPSINPLTGKMREVPYATCTVLLDGGDAVLKHFLEEKDPDKIAIGKRVKAVWREEREGKLTDILCFRIIE